MEFIISISDVISPKEAKDVLTFLSKMLVDKGFTVLYEEVSELKNKNFPIGDSSIEEETFFQTKIRRMSKKKTKNCAVELCSVEE